MTDDFAVTDDFADHPKSITEIKADKTDLAVNWTPRDALTHLLREIDSGRLNARAIVIGIDVLEDDGSKGFHRSVAVPDHLTAVGLASTLHHKINEGP